jgi:hypothetical protein
MDLDEARQYVVNFHRHNGLPSGQAKFAVGASDGQQLVGVAIVSKPVARALNDGATLEVTRVCVVDGARGCPNCDVPPGQPHSSTCPRGLTDLLNRCEQCRSNGQTCSGACTPGVTASDAQTRSPKGTDS